jgi:hypothetical protein
VLAGAAGILIDGPTTSGNVVQGNYVGTDVSGAAPLVNIAGIVIANRAHNNTIGGTIAGAGNVVSGNNTFSGSVGIGIAMGSANVVQGNLIGTDFTGTRALGNWVGISISAGATDNTVGGILSTERNVISGNGGDGVAISGAGTSRNVFLGNYIGIGANGAAIGNAGSGVNVYNSNDNTIGGTISGAGNVISANGGEGIIIAGQARNNVVQGNFIGTDSTGTAALGNSGNGVNLYFTNNNTIGGATPGARNIISGNGIEGVPISGGASNNSVQGNFIGTDITGTRILGNRFSGVGLFNTSDNTIGGTASGAGNLISGNGANGVTIYPQTSGNLVQGNLIGTNVAGSAALPNNGDGVLITDGANSTIGGLITGARNVISGNGQDGVGIVGNNATGNVLQGNYIGTDVTGTQNLANSGNGVLITSASGNTIGGPPSGAGNVIANSGNDGVLVDTGTGNAVGQNSIHDSSNLGIELVNNGNNNQPAPALMAGITDGSSITITGTLTAAPSTSYTLDFFASPTANPSGFGEGQQYLGSATVPTPASGTANFTFNFSVSVPVGRAISATATDPANNTSAFAQDVTARVGLAIVPTFDGSITNDPNAADIENTINSAIQVYMGTYSNAITVQIYFKEMTTGVGQSFTGVVYDSTYAGFRSGLAANQASSGQSDQATALAHLPNQANNPVTNNTHLFVKPANGRALGQNTPGVLDSNGSIHTGGTYDGIISLNTSDTFPPQPIDTSFSLMAVTEHETDEVLGLGSALPNGPDPLAEDLYRYDGSGNRWFISATTTAYFSIDGTTNLVQFHNTNDGGDYGDWENQAGNPQVQDYSGTRGATPSLGVELTALDVLGYDRLSSGPRGTPWPAPQGHGSPTAARVIRLAGGPAEGAALVLMGNGGFGSIAPAEAGFIATLPALDASAERALSSGPVPAGGAALGRDNFSSGNRPGDNALPAQLWWAAPVAASAVPDGFALVPPADASRKDGSDLLFATLACEDELLQLPGLSGLSGFDKWRK